MFTYNTASNLALCKEIVDQASQLLYYSHIPTAVVALLIGFFVLYENRGSLLSRILFIITLSFAVWSALDLVAWIRYDNSTIVMFAWSFFGIVQTCIYLFSFYFIAVFINNGKDIHVRRKVIGLLAVLPILILTPTIFNLSGFSAPDCAALENNLYTTYYYLFSLITVVLTIIYVAFKYKSISSEARKPLVLLTLGIEFFLIIFFVAVVGVSYLLDNGYITNGNYSLEQYGLFSMPIFVAFLAYVIVKFKAFDIKLLASQALVWSIVVLVGAQYFFIRNSFNYFLNSVTFIGAIIAGVFLIKSVKKEVEQRQRLEQLRLKLEESNLKLEVANDKLKDLDKLKTEFLSLAAHQLRSPLTAIRGYTSMLLDGSYGTFEDKQKDAINRVFESSTHLSKVVEDLLNVSKIEAGGMKYEMAPFDMEKAAKDLATDLSITAEKKGLKLAFTTDNKAPYTIHGDMEKLRQVMLNIIDNAIKYTEKGSITVSLSKIPDTGMIRLAVTDTGMGISAEEKEKLFQKFSRGAGGKTNTGGSGLGLYLAKQIAEAHGGHIMIDSPGVGLGSTFSIELKAV